jgi:hypothetical protein
MNKFLRKIIFAYLLIFSFGSWATDFESLKSDIAKDIASQTNLPNLVNIWNELVTNGYYDFASNSKEAKEEATKIQAIIEEHLSKLPADFAEAYIVAPLPPTPLRLIGLANPFCDDGKELCPSFNRTNTLRNFIKANHKVDFIYSHTGDEVQGIKLFNNFMEGHPNAIGTLVNQVPDNLQGATYYFKLDDSTYIFSLCGNQEGSDASNHWQLWFGFQDSEENLLRSKEVFEFVMPLIPGR